MKQIFSVHIPEHMKEKVTGVRQYGPTEAKSHLTSSIVFCDKMTEFVGIIHLNSSKAFYFLFPHNIPVSNLGCHSLHG